MSVINVAADQVSRCSANEHVGRKMSIRRNARQTHKRGESIGAPLRNGTRIFSCKHCGSSPRQRRMFGRERRIERAFLPKYPTRIVNLGPAALRYEFELFGRYECVRESFSQENAAFP